MPIRFPAPLAPVTSSPSPHPRAASRRRCAVVEALGSLGVPVVTDVECGHVQPFMLLVNGALGRLRWVGDERTLTQTFTA